MRAVPPVYPTWEPFWRQLYVEMPDIARHSLRVRHYAGTLAIHLCPSDSRLIQSIRLAALLHDIGKLDISRDILDKPTTLSEAEMAIIRQHPEEAVRKLRHHIVCVDALATIAHHHEWWDGTGYPDGLAGQNIPFGARILAVADAFDAMTSVRPYRPALDVPAAQSVLVAGAGMQWDPDVVRAFMTPV